MMFRAGGASLRLAQLLRRRHLCSARPGQSSSSNNGVVKAESEVEAYTREYNDALKKLENPDFMTAAEVLFTCPPKRKKFGVDFHLVQFFFACLPSLAIYLLAQYSRSEMKRMDAELEMKRKKEEEVENEKKKKEIESNPVLMEVRGRLDKLEETIREIAVESKKRASESTPKDRDDGGMKKPATVEPSKSQVGSEATNSKEKDHPSQPKPSEKSGVAPATEDAQGTIRSAGSSEDSENRRKPV